MGLTNWRGAKVRKEDVTIAKNCLSEPELAALNNLVEQYLLFAEGRAMRRIPKHMREWIAKLNAQRSNLPLPLGGGEGAFFSNDSDPDSTLRAGRHAMFLPWQAAACLNVSCGCPIAFHRSAWVSS